MRDLARYVPPEPLDPRLEQVHTRVGSYYRMAAGRTHSISNWGHTVHGLLAMTRGQLIRALWDAHALGSTATAARVERELLRRGQPLR